MLLAVQFSYSSHGVIITGTHSSINKNNLVVMEKMLEF